MRSRGQRHRLYRNAASGRRPAVGTPLTILGSSLIAYWTLDEASGTRADSHTNALHLTDNNTVTQAAGRVGNAAQFTAANSESLSRADDALLDMGDIDFTIAAWVYLDSDATMVVVSKGDVTSGEYGLRISSLASGFQFSVDNATSNAATAAVSASTWYFVVAWHDATANTVNISLNNAATVSTAEGTVAAVGANTFRIGADGAAGRYMNGRVDEVGLWKRLLTADERTWLYAYGGGS